MRVNISNNYNFFIDKQKNLSNKIDFASVLSQKICTDQNRTNHPMDTFQTMVRSSYHNYSDYSLQSSNRNIETENYKISQDERSGYITVYDKKANVSVVMHSVSDLVVQRDIASGTKLLINDFGNGFFRAVQVNDELEGALKKALNMDAVKEKELSDFQVHTDQKTGIRYITANGFEGRGGVLLLDDEGREKLTSLAKEYMEQYPQLIKSMDEAVMFAAFEVSGIAKRTANGIMMLGADSLSFHDKNGVDGWTILFDELDYEIFLKEWKVKTNANELERMNHWKHKENSKSSAGKASHEETKGFDIPFLGTKSNLPSFVGKAYTREELLQSVNDEVKQNQGKKMSLADMVRSAHLEGTRAKFRFAGDSKIYTFDEYIQELEKRSKMKTPLEN